MTINFYWGEYEEIKYSYELTSNELKELKELVKKDVIDNLEGKTIEEKAKYIIEENDWEDGDAEDIIDEYVDLVIDEGEYDDLARELFGDSAREQYSEEKSYKDEYDYYGISKRDFF